MEPSATTRLASSAPFRAKATTFQAPITSVRVSRGAVSVYERTAQVSGDGEISIPLSAADMMRAMKTMVAADAGDGTVSAIRYNVGAPEAA
jgi:hypothetical protein